MSEEKKLYDILSPIILQKDINAFHEFMNDISDYEYAKQFNDYKSINKEVFNEKYLQPIAKQLIRYWYDNATSVYLKTDQNIFNFENIDNITIALMEILILDYQFIPDKDIIDTSFLRMPMFVLLHNYFALYRSPVIVGKIFQRECDNGRVGLDNIKKILNMGYTLDQFDEVSIIKTCIRSKNINTLKLLIQYDINTNALNHTNIKPSDDITDIYNLLLSQDIKIPIILDLIRNIPFYL